MDQVVIQVTSATSYSTNFQSGINYHYPDTVYPPFMSSCSDSEKSWLRMDPFFLPTIATSSAIPAITSQIPPSSVISTTPYPLQNIPLSPSMILQRPPTTVSSLSNCTSKTLSGSEQSSTSFNADIVPPSTWVGLFTYLLFIKHLIHRFICT